MKLKDKIKLFIFKKIEQDYMYRINIIYNILLCDDIILDYIYKTPYERKSDILRKMSYDLYSENEFKQIKTIDTVYKLLLKSEDEPELAKVISDDLLSLVSSLIPRDDENVRSTIINILGHRWREYVESNDNWVNFFDENWKLKSYFQNLIHVVDEESLNKKLESLLPYFNNLLDDSKMYFSPRYADENLKELIFLLGIELELRKNGTSNKKRYDEILSIIYNINRKNYASDKKLYGFSEKDRREYDVSMKSIIKKYEEGELEFFEFYDTTRMFVTGHYSSDICSFDRTRTFELSRLNNNQINNLNLKSYNKLKDLIDSKYAEDTYPTAIIRLTLNMYLTLGLQKSMDIINGLYGEIDFPLLENMFGGLNTLYIKIPKFKGEPVYDKEHLKFLDFWFASSTLDPNANIKKLISGEISSEDISFEKCFEEWDTIYELLDGDITVDKVKTMLSDYLIELRPAREEIRDVFKFLSKTRHNIFTTFELHDKMVKRTSSTIPKIYGHIGNFEYEMLDLNDPEQLIVGDLTNCCFTINGISHTSLNHAVSNKNGRIFVVREDDQIIAQSWVWRNGNVLCFDNIEKPRLKNKVNVLKAYKKAAQDIIDISIANEPKENAINLITVGVSFTKDIEKLKRLKLDIMPKPNVTDIYLDSAEQAILHQSKGFKLEDISYFEPEIQYQDPRQTIKDFDFSNSFSHQVDDIVNVMNKVGYFNDLEKHIDLTKEDILDKYVYVIYNNDWYVAITNDNSIDYKMLNYDKRAKEEVEANLIQIKENLQNINKTEKVRSR